MSGLVCRLGCATSSVQIPDWAANGDPSVAQHFIDASQNHILMEIDQTPLAQPPSSSRNFQKSYDLHYALRALLGNPPTDGHCEAVGVVFADQYFYDPGFLGLMFDQEFDIDPREGSQQDIAGPPREGCAVFLGAIAATYPPTSTEYAFQTQFTTIHELGHVFNLQHHEDTHNFLHTSTVDSALNMDYWHFIPDHEQRLRRADADSHIWPGGSAFQDLGPGGSADEQWWTQPANFGVELVLGLARRSFYHFEPVELDVELRVMAGVQSRVVVPDTLDPGFSNFRIWVEEPAGERRRYRSPRHYCYGGKTRVIEADKPFRRDISIFGEAGGYTFRRAGIHRIWAELLLPDRSVVRSSPIDVEIRPIRSDKEWEQRAFFERRLSRVVLYHRVDRHQGRGIKRLEAWLQKHAEDPAAGSVHYAVARSIREQSDHTGSRLSPPRKARVFDHLGRALDSAWLGYHQRHLAEQMRRDLAIKTGHRHKSTEKKEPVKK